MDTLNTLTPNQFTIKTIPSLKANFVRNSLTDETTPEGKVHKVCVTALTCEDDQYGQSVWKTKNGSSAEELKQNELILSTNRNRVDVIPYSLGSETHDKTDLISYELPEVYIVESGDTYDGSVVTLKLGDKIKPGTELRVVRKGANTVKLELTDVTNGFDGDSTRQDFELDRDDQKVGLVYFDDGSKKTWYIIG